VTNLRQLIKAGRQNEFVWRYGFNFMPSVLSAFQPGKHAAPEAARVLADLNRDGIAITSVEKLLGRSDLFAQLEKDVEKLLEVRDEDLSCLKETAEAKDLVVNKTFNVELLGSQVAFDPKSVFARFALQDSFLNIANAYFRMLVKLRYFNVWYTFATSGDARESQLWHFDREDNYILKVFLYLRDVDEGSGPFTYAPETHRKGRNWGSLPEFSLEEGVRRSTDGQMAKIIPASKWIKAVGKKGTIVFADTRGFHKGGEARTSDRLMYTCMYTSPASDSKRLITFPAETTSLSRRQRNALEAN
jgi:hypothetical protein